MKIFCLTCREHILNTTATFVMGAEYDGSMFVPAGRGKIWGNMFRQNASVRRANLFCPRCEGQFIRNGKLLTEYGVIQPGQAAVDESFTIVAGDDHPLPGRIMFIKDSIDPGAIMDVVGPSYSDIVIAERPIRDKKSSEILKKVDEAVVDRGIEMLNELPNTDRTEEKVIDESEAEMKRVKSITDAIDELREKAAIAADPAKKQGDYICPNCSKPYKPSAKHWFDKHVEGCAK